MKVIALGPNVFDPVRAWRRRRIKKGSRFIADDVGASWLNAEDVALRLKRTWRITMHYVPYSDVSTNSAMSCVGGTALSETRHA
jgi:hypothetical protein